MSLDIDEKISTLPRPQRDFLNTYFSNEDKSKRQKGRKKKKAGKFAVSRQELKNLIERTHYDNKQKPEFLKRQGEIEELANDGRFREAKEQANELAVQVALSLEGDLEAVRNDFENLKATANYCQEKVEKIEEWRNNQFKAEREKCQLLPEKSIPDSKTTAPSVWIETVEKLVEQQRQLTEGARSFREKRPDPDKNRLKGLASKFSNVKLTMTKLALNPGNTKLEEEIRQLDEEIKSYELPKNVQGRIVQSVMDDMGLVQIEMQLDRDMENVRVVEAQWQRLQDEIAVKKYELANPGTELTEEMREEIRNDRRMEGMVNGPRDLKAPKLEAFDPTAALEMMKNFKLPEGQEDENSELYGQHVTVAENLFRKFLNDPKTKPKPESDEAFDLSLKVPKDFAVQFAISRGWAKKGASELPGELEPNQKALCMACGKGMHKAMLETQSNKLEVTNEVMTLNIGGKKYVDGEVIGQGSFGKVMRFQDAEDPGKQIVVKSMLSQNEKQHKSIVRELRNHRKLMKGTEDTQGRKNVVALHGALQSENGELMMVMESVSGGDVEDSRYSQGVASDQGFLPEQARVLMNQRSLKQMAEGLQCLRDNNMIHFDLKGQNVLIDEHGTLKIADFGSSAFSGKSDGVMKRNMGESPGTPNYDKNQGVVTSKTDIFSMGKIAEVMQVRSWLAKDQNSLQGGALSRLRKAMTSKKETDTISLEGVLQSSYLGNLENYDEGEMDELAKTTVAFSNAMKKEVPELLQKSFSGEEVELIKKMMGKTKVESLRPAELMQKIQSNAGEIRDRENWIEHSDENRKKQYREEIEELKKVKPLLEKYQKLAGKTSAECKKLGEQMKQQSLRLLYPGPETDFQGLMHFMDALEKEAGNPTAFLTFVTLPSNVGFLRAMEIDPAQVRMAARVGTMKTSERPEQTHERLERGEEWDPMKELARVDFDIKTLLGGIQDGEMRGFFKKALDGAYKRTEEEIMREVVRQEQQSKQVQEFPKLMETFSQSLPMFVKFVRTTPAQRGLAATAGITPREITDAVECYEALNDEEMEFEEFDAIHLTTKPRMGKVVQKINNTDLKPTVGRALATLFKAMGEKYQRLFLAEENRTREEEEREKEQEQNK